MYEASETKTVLTLENFDQTLENLIANYKEIYPRLERHAVLVKGMFDSFFSIDDSVPFGVQTISVRAKAPESLKARFQQKKEDIFKEDQQSNIGKAHTHENLVKFSDKNNPLPSVWCSALQDLIGVRLIVETQRQRFQVYRAIEYLCDICETDQRYLVGIHAPIIRRDNTRKWKFFNPPVSRAYYQPAAISEFLKLSKELAAHASKHGSELQKQQGRVEHGVPNNEFEKIFKQVSAFEERHSLTIDFKDSGYATLQRNIFVLIQDVPVLIEVQIRTELEHAFAERQHKMAYKFENPVTEEVNGLFKAFGNSLAESDDLRQMAFDKYRASTNEKADYRERSLKTYDYFEYIDGSDKQIESFELDLKELYTLVRLGYIGDSIVFAEHCYEKYKGIAPSSKSSVANSKRLYETFAIEEAICRMHNLKLHDMSVDLNLSNLNDTRVYKLLESVTDEKLLLWKEFRVGQYYLIALEVAVVEYLRNLHSKEAATESVRSQLKDNYIRILTGARTQLENALSRIDQKREEHERYLGKLLSAEIKLLMARSYRWEYDLCELATGRTECSKLDCAIKYSDSAIATLFEIQLSDEHKTLTNEDLERIKSFSSTRESTSKLISESDPKKKTKIGKPAKSTEQNLDLTSNDIDLAALNYSIWYRRLIYRKLANEVNNDQSKEESEQCLSITSQLVEIMKLQSNNNERRDFNKALHHMIQRHESKQQIDEEFGQSLSKLSIHDLKVLDTIIGYLDMKNKADGQPDTMHLLGVLNNKLAEALVKLASRGDFSFDSYFAFNLLADNRR